MITLRTEAGRGPVKLATMMMNVIMTSVPAQRNRKFGFSCN